MARVKNEGLAAGPAEVIIAAITKRHQVRVATRYSSPFLAGDIDAIIAKILGNEWPNPLNDSSLNSILVMVTTRNYR